MPTPAKTLYPAVGVYYRVQFAGDTNGPDAAFREVTGLSVALQTEEIVEGGENRFRHRVPTAAKFDNLVMKRGLCGGKSPLYQWLATGIGGGLASALELRALLVVLMNDKGQPLRTWNLVNAWPVKWELSGLNAMDAQVVIESLEVCYQYFELK